jgi:hypothetical protein
MEIGSREFWDGIERIADMMQKQEWAKIIPEIPQSKMHYLKNKNRRSANAEERKENEL